jgi:XTP/dITP diphosphohydrolase
MQPDILIFATNNANKVAEVQHACGGSLHIISLKEAGINVDIPEPYDTLHENAAEKCRVIHRLTGGNCFGEDTGLEVAALNGAPGVRSARYAGEQRSDADNMRLLLHNLAGAASRTAQFRTVMALIWKGETHLFEGVCTGKITDTPQGENGFGYDPLFVPDGTDRTFAEMTMAEKSRYSHRKKALEKLLAFLQTGVQG